MSSPRPNPIKKAIEGNGGSDDSMHEKYFKSVENTPVSKRRNQSATSSPSQQQKQSSDSSPHSPMSPKKNVRIFTFTNIDLIFVFLMNNFIFNKFDN